MTSTPSRATTTSLRSPLDRRARTVISASLCVVLAQQDRAELAHESSPVSPRSVTAHTSASGASWRRRHVKAFSRRSALPRDYHTPASTSAHQPKDDHRRRPRDRQRRRPEVRATAVMGIRASWTSPRPSRSTTASRCRASGSASGGPHRAAEVQDALRWALEAGYRHVDTARLYGNERDVGRVLRESGLPRDQVFITTKLQNRDHGYLAGAARARRKPRGPRPGLRGPLPGPLAGGGPAAGELARDGRGARRRQGARHRRQQLPAPAPGRAARRVRRRAGRRPGGVLAVPLSARAARVLPGPRHPAGGVQPAHAGKAARRPGAHVGRRRARQDAGAGAHPLGAAARPRGDPQVGDARAHRRERGRVRLRAHARGHGAAGRARRRRAPGVGSRRTRREQG